MRRMNLIFRLLLVLSLVLTGAGLTLAHGVDITHTIDPASGAITISASFDTGEALDAAQVAVFAPSDLLNPWLTGTTDASGAFTFTPDYADEGTWDVQVRRAGHGGLMHLALNASMQVAARGVSGTLGDSVSAGFTPAQIILMAASVVWGFIGTALYFMSRQNLKQVQKLKGGADAHP